MKLEEEIKQKKFQSEQHKAILNIIFTAGWIKSFNINLLRPFGISGEQYNVLRILRGQHPLPTTVCTIQERMLDRMSNASRLVEKLRLKGLVERKECERDRRLVDINISIKGLELLKKLDFETQKDTRVFSSITEEEAQTLNNILDKFRT